MTRHSSSSALTIHFTFHRLRQGWGKWKERTEEKMRWKEFGNHSRTFSRQYIHDCVWDSMRYTKERKTESEKECGIIFRALSRTTKYTRTYVRHNTHKHTSPDTNTFANDCFHQFVFAHNTTNTYSRIEHSNNIYFQWILLTTTVPTASTEPTKPFLVCFILCICLSLLCEFN